MEFLHDAFTVFKFFFGLGALGALLAIGLMLLWFSGHVIVRLTHRGLAAGRNGLLRKLFLES